MTHKYKQIRVYLEDVEKMRKEGVELLKKEQPALNPLKLSDAFMFKRMVRYFIK